MNLLINYFDHEKLHVYQAAKEFLIITETIIKQFPKGRAYLSEKIRFYRMAMRSATECAGIIDICRDLDLVDEEMSMKARTVLLRVVAMLTIMA
jgi:hypothetical protein